MIITRLYVNKIRVTTSMSSIIIPCSSSCFTSNGNRERDPSSCCGNPPVNSYILNPITFGRYPPNKADAVMGHGERAPRTESFIHFSYTNSSRFASPVSRILSRDEIIPVPLPVPGTVNSFATSKIVNHVRFVKYNFSPKFCKSFDSIS